MTAMVGCVHMKQVLLLLLLVCNTRPCCMLLAASNMHRCTTACGAQTLPYRSWDLHATG
jgi:hypothetical protein